ncbi:YciI family protein [Glycomyces tarimensis]
MQYAMFICGPGGAVDSGGGAVSAEDRAAVAESIRLRPATDATTVRLRGDEVTLTDGPAAESTGAIAGVDLVEADDLDEAIALAAAHPAVLDGGAIEVRPVWT